MPEPNRLRTVLIFFPLSTCLLVTAWAQKPQGDGKAREAGAPVNIGTVRTSEIPEEYKTFGTVLPKKSVALRPQVTGVLASALAEEGSVVKAGQLLFELDSRPFDAALSQAEAKLAQSEAQLEQARRESARQVELFKKGVSSEDARDQAESAAKAASASVQMDQAALLQAKIQREYCRILSPADGRIGELGIHPGNVVKANDTVLAVVNQLQPTFVQFSIPQQQLPRLLAMPDQRLAVKALGPGPAAEPESGILSFIDNAVDPSTGTVRLKALFQNQAEKLWPGQFVNVTLCLGSEKALVVPDSAIQKGQSGDKVFVVKKDLTVELRSVEKARSAGSLAVIRTGLEEGEQVVTDGQMRLFPGAKVSLAGDGQKEKGTKEEAAVPHR